MPPVLAFCSRLLQNQIQPAGFERATKSSSPEPNPAPCGAKEKMSEFPPVLDVCCGSRMFWFDPKNPNALFCDKREEKHILCDGRELIISPDVQCDFTALPFPDNTFYLVVFDPPHMNSLGENSWLAKTTSASSPSFLRIQSVVSHPSEFVKTLNFLHPQASAMAILCASFLICSVPPVLLPAISSTESCSPCGSVPVSCAYLGRLHGHRLRLLLCTSSV